MLMMKVMVMMMVMVMVMVMMMMMVMVREYALHLGSGDRLLLPVPDHVGLVWGDPGKRVHRHDTRSTNYIGSIHCCLRRPP